MQNDYREIWAVAVVMISPDNRELDCFTYLKTGTVKKDAENAAVAVAIMTHPDWVVKIITSTGVSLKSNHQEFIKCIMTIDQALSLTAKPIPDHLAQNFFGTMHSHLSDGTTLAEEFIDWCETHKERLTEDADGLDFHPLVGWRDLEEPHNPDGLDVSTVGTGDGWRLLNKNEIKECGTSMDEIETWYKRCFWDAGWSGDSIARTYRTRLTPEELAVKRKEAK